MNSPHESWLEHAETYLCSLVLLAAGCRKKVQKHDILWALPSWGWIQRVSSTADSGPFESGDRDWLLCWAGLMGFPGSPNQVNL